MRIAFLTSQFPGIRMGGIGSNTLAIARGLADVGHDVHVFTFHLPADLLATLPKNITFHPTSDLAQCAADMITLARAVYGIDLTVPRPMSVRALAEVFAAFRWGGLLKKHGVSAMEFPYSVAGLTEYHTKMHWPAINEPKAPDKPGGKFKQPFGAVPVVLSLKYPATV